MGLPDVGGGRGRLLVDHPDQIGPLAAIGLDETLLTRTGQCSVGFGFRSFRTYRIPRPPPR